MAAVTATQRARTFPSSQRELVAASLAARPERRVAADRPELTFPRA